MIFRFLWPFIRPHLGRVALGIVFAVVFAAANGLFLFGMGKVLERLEPGSGDTSEVEVVDGGWKWLDEAKIRFEQEIEEWLPRQGKVFTLQQGLGLVLLIFGVSVLRGGANFASSYYLRWAAVYAVRDLKRTVLDKFHSMSLDFFSKSTLGDLLTRVDKDTKSLNVGLGTGVADLVKQPLTFITTVGAILLVVDGWLTLMALVFFPLCVVPVYYFGRRVRKMSKLGRQEMVEQSSKLIDSLGLIRVVKAYGLEGVQREEFEKSTGRIARLEMKKAVALGFPGPIIEAISALSFCVVIAMAFYVGSSVAELGVFLMGLLLAYAPAKKMAGLHSRFQEASVCVERLREVLEMEPTVKERGVGRTVEGMREGVVFEQVVFDYGNGKEVLKGVDLKISKGEMVGVAGPSGSGKSTLVNLLLRFYDPTGGRMLWDGVDFKECSVESLRRNVALVSQDVAIFNRSVLENIRYGRMDATEEEVREAARAAFAEEFIEALPKGYETVLGERGVSISGGQKQRIALARAFLRDAPLLVLDEATASLDSESERYVQEAVDRLASERTVVVVAHRLSTLRGANRVVVLDEGKVVEVGGFEELLKKKGGIFSRLASQQGIYAGEGA